MTFKLLTFLKLKIRVPRTVNMPLEAQGGACQKPTYSNKENFFWKLNIIKLDAHWALFRNLRLPFCISREFFQYAPLFMYRILRFFIQIAGL
jgi:hypothetical protein